MYRWCLLSVPLLLVAGCGFPAAKVDEAKGHVKAGLEKWQAGGKPDELRPVEFNEAMWNAGEKLVSFELGEARYVDSVQAVRCQVRLTLQKGKSKARTENVTYDITFGPSVKVVNNPMP